jgi:4-hydroxy-tetrahydrodipicolinate synthase
MAMTLGTGNGAVKEALTLIGRSCGPNRSPVSPLGEDKKLKLMGILEKAGLLR